MKNLFETAYNDVSLNEMAAKYYGYVSRSPKDIVFRDPDNQEQLKKAKKIRRKVLLMVSIATVIFFLSGVLAFLNGNKPSLVLFIGIFTLGLFVYTLFLLCQRTQIATGRVVLKHVNNTIGSRKRNTYLVSVAIDYPEKIICTDIQMNLDDYERSSEGTPVLLVKNFTSCQACIL